MTHPSTVLNQAEIENEIMRLSGALEETTDAYGEELRESRNAEATYRVEYAKSYTRHKMGGEKMTEETVKQKATIECSELLGIRLSHEALERYLEEKCRSLRAQLDAVRTLSANVRAQT